MSVNINSITDSYNAWKDYYYNNNSLGITDKEIGMIEERWQTNLAKWKAQAESTDENQYHISDDDYNSSVNDGKTKASEQTEFDGKDDRTGSRASVAVSAIGAAGAIAATVMSTIILGAKKAADSLKIACGWVVAAVGALLLGLAAGLKAANLNKESTDACQTMMDEVLPEAQSQLAGAQTDMDNASDEVRSLTEEADDNNEDTNDEIADNKEQFDVFRETLLALQEKVRNGEPLTDSEKELMKELLPILEELGITIEQLAEDNTDFVSDLYDKIGEKQEVFDTSAETIAEVQGKTDFAASFDEQTVTNTELVKTAATIGTYSAGLNAAAGGVAIAKCWSVFDWPEKIAAIIGVATSLGATFLFNSVKNQQSEYKTIAEAEVKVRETTQDLHAETLGSYETQVEEFDENLGLVEDLDMVVPDEEDMKIPEDISDIQENGNAGQGTDGTNNVNGTGDPNNTSGTNPFGSVTAGNTTPTANGINDNNNNNNNNGVNNPQTTANTGTNSKAYTDIMGKGANYIDVARGIIQGGQVIADNNDRVVLSPDYANAIRSVVQGNNGEKFGVEHVPAIIANLLPDPFNEDMIKKIMNGEELESKYVAEFVKTLPKENGEPREQHTGVTYDVDTTKQATNIARRTVNFYSHIFTQAAARGWTDSVQGDIEEMIKNGTLKIV